MILVQLGKFGDIVNVLPLAFMLHKKLGGRVRWVVGKQWASILEGASYVEPIIFEGSDDDLSRAIQQYRGHQTLVTQAWKNPDTMRLTDSFAKEQWRYAEALEEMGKWPLVFDRRDKEREQSLCNRFAPLNKKPIVLCATRAKSVSYKGEFKLVAALREQLDANVIDISADIAHRIYDLIGLYDISDLLITVDTCHAHLARASYCPVIMLRADGWMGAPPPPQSIASWPYAELCGSVDPVISVAKKQLARKSESLAVVCCTYNPISDRHKRAAVTHPKDTIYAKFDFRPRLKQLLTHGLNAHKDVVVFTNDDVTFPGRALDKILKHAQKFDFGCSRRPGDPIHVGREIFWFRDDWLRKMWHYIPDVFWTVQKCDLILCRWLRQQKGIPATPENLYYDFPPVDVPGVIYHEDHPSHWTSTEVQGSMESQHNEKLWRDGV